MMGGATWKVLTPTAKKPVSYLMFYTLRLALPGCYVPVTNLLLELGPRKLKGMHGLGNNLYTTCNMNRLWISRIYVTFPRPWEARGSHFKYISTVEVFATGMKMESTSFQKKTKHSRG